MFHSKPGKGRIIASEHRSKYMRDLNGIKAVLQLEEGERIDCVCWHTQESTKHKE